MIFKIIKNRIKLDRLIKDKYNNIRIVIITIIILIEDSNIEIVGIIINLRGRSIKNIRWGIKRRWRLVIMKVIMVKERIMVIMVVESKIKGYSIILIMVILNRMIYGVMYFHMQIVFNQLE